MTREGGPEWIFGQSKIIEVKGNANQTKPWEKSLQQ